MYNVEKYYIDSAEYKEIEWTYIEQWTVNRLPLVVSGPFRPCFFMYMNVLKDFYVSFRFFWSDVLRCKVKNLKLAM